MLLFLLQFNINLLKVKKQKHKWNTFNLKYIPMKYILFFTKFCFSPFKFAWKPFLFVIIFGV